MKIKAAVVMVVCLLVYATFHVRAKYGVVGLATFTYIVLIAAVLVFCFLAFRRTPPPED